MNESTKSAIKLNEILGSQENYRFIDLSVDLEVGHKIAFTLKGTNSKNFRFRGDNITPDRKPKAKKKQLHTEIELTFDQSFKILKVFIHKHVEGIYVLGKRNSSIILEPELFMPTKSIVKTYYKRPTKIKVLNACFMGAGLPYASIDYALAKCDILIAVDTNCKTLKTGKKVAATTAMPASATVVHDGVILFSQEKQGMQIINFKPKGNPEIFGIGKILFRLFEERPELINKKVGVITDTEYDLLESMNKREVPFYEDFFLPENVTLFYSSSDVGSQDFSSNKLIKMCDKESTKLLDKYLFDNNLI